MKNKNGLTYADAGVDIDAGNSMVEEIKPLVRGTRRPGADAAHVQLRHWNDCHCRLGQDRPGFARLPPGTENPVTLGRVVAIEAGEMVGYSGRLAL